MSSPSSTSGPSSFTPPSSPSPSSSSSSVSAAGQGAGPIVSVSERAKVSNKWDRCIENGIVKIGTGVLLGGLASMLLLRTNAWRVFVTGSVGGFMGGIAYTDCQKEFSALWAPKLWEAKLPFIQSSSPANTNPTSANSSTSKPTQTPAPAATKTESKPVSAPAANPKDK